MDVHAPSARSARQPDHSPVWWRWYPWWSLLVLLAAWPRWPAWLATLVGSIITFALAAWLWKMPVGDGWHAYLYGAATGVWNVDWITLCKGMVLFNTLTVSGGFENFRRWLIAHGTMDVRVQTMLFAWAFGALLEVVWSGSGIPGQWWRRS